MSAKTVEIDWKLEPGTEIPVNSQLSAECELYPFAFVSAEEFFQERETLSEKYSPFQDSMEFHQSFA